MSSLAIPAAEQDLARKVKSSGTSFLAGMRLLPPPRRTAMYALYAFCRTVDDIADDVPVPAEKLAGLLLWRQKIARLYKGEADDPITQGLRIAIRDYAIREEDLIAIIAGMEMDAGPPFHAPAQAILDLYCDRVASAVGRASVRIFGCSGETLEAGDAVAYHLGRALQMTNILRDLAEDAARGRLYLPREMLRDAGIDVNRSALAVISDPRLPQACQALAALAATHFARAEEAMASCPPAAMKPARLMAAYYRAIHQKLCKGQFKNPHRRVRLTAWQKLFLAFRVGVLGA